MARLPDQTPGQDAPLADRWNLFTVAEDKEIARGISLVDVAVT